MSSTWVSTMRPQQREQVMIVLLGIRSSRQRIACRPDQEQTSMNYLESMVLPWLPAEVTGYSVMCALPQCVLPPTVREFPTISSNTSRVFPHLVLPGYYAQPRRELSEGD